MAKLSGMILILTGCAGFLCRWYQRGKYRQAVMEEWIRLFARWNDALCHGQIRLYDFLDRYEARIPEVEAVLTELKTLLEQNCYSTGEAAWQKSLSDNRDMLLSAEAMEIVLWAGEGFFGFSSRESRRITEMAGKRMEEVLAFERQDMKKKWKVYVPAGMFFGVMLVILLV